MKLSLFAGGCCDEAKQRKTPQTDFLPGANGIAVARRDTGRLQIYASYYGSRAAGFFGNLKVVRTTDGRMLFPYDGAEKIGPFSTIDEAVTAAQALGEGIVAGDLRHPEL